MFAFFFDDCFFGFWSNNIGDIFLDATCDSLKKDKLQTHLNYYFHTTVPKFYEFDSNKNMVVKKEVISFSEVVSVDSNGDEIVTQVENKAYEIDQIIEPVAYYAKGVMIRPC